MVVGAYFSGHLTKGCCSLKRPIVGRLNYDLLCTEYPINISYWMQERVRAWVHQQVDCSACNPTNCWQRRKHTLKSLMMAERVQEEVHMLPTPNISLVITITASVMTCAITADRILTFSVSAHYTKTKTKTKDSEFSRWWWWWCQFQLQSHSYQHLHFHRYLQCNNHPMPTRLKEMISKSAVEEHNPTRTRQCVGIPPQKQCDVIV